MGHAAETLKGALQTKEEHLHGLALEEAQPQQARIAQDHQERVAPSPGQAEAAEVHLTLAACWCLVAHHGVSRLARARQLWTYSLSLP